MPPRPRLVVRELRTLEDMTAAHGLFLQATAIAVAIFLHAEPAAAQDVRRRYVGGLAGVSTLSADGRSITTASEADLSLYKPENGCALNLFAGWHLAEYFTLQANWMWN